jgi:hypothetical protein
MRHSLVVLVSAIAAWSLGLTAWADEPKSPGWLLTRSIAAPEAVQAAAAHENAIFAISSTQVAKYDRLTGERIAISTGDAQHLNSGFVWEGRLLLAHSNYPRLPECSEIKVLNPETMRLTTYKDFADFGGSLTWVVRKNGEWWCNFARYGAKNAETFLVRFDSEWRELARYTYPPEVIAQIGQMSLSGGLWRGDSLLVTDHDHPVLYELRVPASGSVLKYVGKHAAPFTGQGIAADPQTGGLVGINRAKRQVVFASQRLAEPVIWNFTQLDQIGGHKTSVVGAPRVIDTPEGKAVEFDGVDDGLFIDFNPLAGMEKFTAEVIFRPDAGGPPAQRFVHLQEDGGENRLLFETRLTADNRWFLDTFIKSGDGNYTLLAEKWPHPIGPWYHAAVVMDGRTMRHFVNGKEELSTPIVFKPQQPGRTSIGVRINKVSWYKGAVRQFRSSPGMLTPEQFLKL